MLQAPLISSNMSVNLLFNEISQLSSPSTSSTTTNPDPSQFCSSSQFSTNNNNFTKTIFPQFETSLPSTSAATTTANEATAAKLSASSINPSSASTLLVAAAAKAAATTATLIQQQRCNNQNLLIRTTNDEQQKIDALLLPALIGHEIANIISQQQSSSSPPPPSYPNIQQPQPQQQSIWRCANLPTTLQVLNTARENFPSYISTIDTLRQSLTQTIFVSLINASSTSSSSSLINNNGIEMPTIASLAPNNTSLHLNNLNSAMKDQIMSVNNEKIPQIGYMESHQVPSVIPNQQISPAANFSPDSSESRRDSLPFIVSSPAKSELSINTDVSSVDIRSDLGSLSIKSEKPGKSALRHVKKRVMCERCQKSFCDKGALKIHNSSVHLREMHICTVPGCTKQFPSKRSRNRHSNNPNMHTDAGRRRNCRTTAKSESPSSEELPSNPQQEEHQPPQQPHQQQPIDSAHSILSILQRLIPTSGIQQNNSSSSPQHPSALSAPVLHSGPASLPQLPFPPQNPELNGLLKFMIAQRSKPTLC